MVADKLSYFREVDLFRGLSENELEECKRELPMFEANKGRLLLVPGRDEQVLYILKRGTVRLYRLSHDGREITLGDLAVGDVFGTLPIFGALSKNTFAVAATEAMICKVTEERLMGLIARHPDMATRLLRILGERLTAAEDQIEDLVFRTAEQRIARSIIRLVETTSRSKLTVSHEEIARSAGVARETVTKMLNELERVGVVKTGYRSLRVLDRDAMDQRAAD